MPCEQLQVSKTLNECSQPEPGFINSKTLLISLKSSPLPHLLFTTTPLSPMSFGSLLSTFDPRTCTKKVLVLCWTLWTILAGWSVDRHHLFPQQPGLECHAAGLHWVQTESVLYLCSFSFQQSRQHFAFHYLTSFFYVAACLPLIMKVTNYETTLSLATFKWFSTMSFSWKI